MRRAALLLSSAIALSACLTLEPAESLDPTPTPSRTPRPTMTPATTPSPTASGTSTATPTPTATPSNVRSAVIELMDTADRPIAGAAVVSTWNDTILDEAQPTAANGVTSLLVADGAWVTAVLATTHAITMAVTTGATYVRMRTWRSDFVPIDVDVVPDSGSGADVYASRFLVGSVASQGTVFVYESSLQRDGRALLSGRRVGVSGVSWGVAVDVPPSTLTPLVLSTAFATANVTIDLLSPLPSDENKFAYAAFTHLGASIGRGLTFTTTATSGQLTVTCLDHASKDGVFVAVGSIDPPAQGSQLFTVAQSLATYVAVDVSQRPPRIESFSADRTQDGRPRFSWTTSTDGVAADALILQSSWAAPGPTRKYWHFVMPAATHSPLVAPAMPPGLAALFANNGGGITAELTLVESDIANGYDDGWLLERDERFFLTKRTSTTYFGHYP